MILYIVVLNSGKKSQGDFVARNKTRIKNDEIASKASFFKIVFQTCEFRIITVCNSNTKW